MNNQLTVDPFVGGPQITGTWFNKKTGKTITVRDSFIGDSGMQIMTSTGELIDMNDFSDNYIQSDGVIYDDTGKPTGEKESIDYEALFKDINSDINTAHSDTSYNDTSYIDTPVENNGENKSNNLNFEIIKKMFSNFETSPSLIIDINWPNIPINELHNIMNLLDISIDDLSDYIFNNFCKTEDIKQGIYNGLNTKLSKKLNK